MDWGWVSSFILLALLLFDRFYWSQRRFNFLKQEGFNKDSVISQKDATIEHLKSQLPDATKLKAAKDLIVEANSLKIENKNKEIEDIKLKYRVLQADFKIIEGKANNAAIDKSMLLHKLEVSEAKSQALKDLIKATEERDKMLGIKGINPSDVSITTFLEGQMLVSSNIPTKSSPKKEKVIRIP